MTTTPWLLTCAAREHTLTGDGAGSARNAPARDEICHALAQINRFNGHASRPYSVAEHSLLVCDIVKAKGGDCHAQLAALLHDAHEAFTGDVATPIKWALGSAWHDFEHTQQQLVQRTYNIISASTAHRALIKHADLTALATERRDLLPYGEGSRPWPMLDTPGAEVPPLEAVDLGSTVRRAMTWRRHGSAMLVRWRDLEAQCDLRAAQIQAPPAQAPGPKAEPKAAPSGALRAVYINLHGHTASIKTDADGADALHGLMHKMRGAAAPGPASPAPSAPYPTITGQAE